MSSRGRIQAILEAGFGTATSPTPKKKTTRDSAMGVVAGVAAKSAAKKKAAAGSSQNPWKGLPVKYVLWVSDL